MEPERLIFHIDVNSAFLSWESVYRLSKDSQALDLRTIPAAVGGDRSSRHGIVLAKSTMAKQAGVATGEPLVQALRKCPELTIVPSRFDIYLDYSAKMFQLLSEYTPDIEKFSIDEAFLDMTQTIHLFGEPLTVAGQIRERIRHELGFTVNIGIAPNKILAKMASDFEKPNMTHTLARDEIAVKMWPLPLRELFFVGRSAQKKMENIGLHTIGDIAVCDPAILRTHLGDKYSRQIHQYANGIDNDPVAPREPVTKGYGNSITLSQDIADLDTARQVLLAIAETVGSRLRAKHVTCNNVCVELKDWNFKSQSHQMNLPAPTDSTTVIYESACRLIQECWDLTPVRLLGIRTTKISEETYDQIGLFEDERTSRLKDLEKAIDKIRGKYGIDSVKRASFLQENTLTDHAVSKRKHLKKTSEEED